MFAEKRSMREARPFLPHLLVVCISRLPAGDLLPDLALAGFMSRLRPYVLIPEAVKQISKSFCIWSLSIARCPLRRERRKIPPINCLKKEGWGCALIFPEAIPFPRAVDPSRHREEEGLCGVNDQQACVTPEQSWLLGSAQTFLVREMCRLIHPSSTDKPGSLSPAQLQRLPHVWVSGSSSCIPSSIITAEEWC